MLKIALPNKGSLSDGAVEIIRHAGYKCRRSGRELMVVDSANTIEFVYLRPRDIPVYVARGIIDLGITGRDLLLDSRAEAAECLALGFGGSTFRYAVPDDSDRTPDTFGGLRIATSYPNLVRDDMKRRGLDVEVLRLDGAVEISIRLGVADAIADVVESGRTLKEAGLKTVGDPVLQSEAVVLSRPPATLPEEDSEAGLMLRRISGILLAREYAMVEYDCPRAVLDDACMVTPGIESPTVAPLNEAEWVAVKAMARKKDVNGIMDRLADLGARGILITDIRTCRL